MKKLFIIALVAFTACNSGTTDSTNNNDAAPATDGSDAANPINIDVSIMGIYPHDTSAYTQGLEIYKGKFYEGTGDFAQSSLRIVDIKSGKVEKKHMMGTSKIFGEGITIFKGKIYQLTWQSHIVNVYDINNIDKPIKTFEWPYEGWGITHNDTELIVSDGSDKLFFVNPEDFGIKRMIRVSLYNNPIMYINELEYVDGAIYGNIYQDDIIVRIDPVTGNVTGKISLPGLLEQYAPGQSIPERTDVLNGIAWDSTSKKMYITGKRWPKMFELMLK